MRIPVITAALVLVASGGCSAKPQSLEREWKQKTARSCASLAELLDGLHRDLTRVQRAFQKEVKKTGPKRALYNPGMFNRLGKMAEKLDLTKPRRRERLRRAAWMTHYRFVKGAGKLLPRLHQLLALLRQLKASLDLGRSQEQKFGTQLEARKPGWTPLAKRKRPQFGLILRGIDHATFTPVPDAPVRRGPQGRCVSSSAAQAEGYRLGDGRCYFFTRPPKRKTECAKLEGTLRLLANTDPKLGKALRCLSMADVLLEGFRFRLLDLELILAELDQVDVAGLASHLRQVGRR